MPTAKNNNMQTLKTIAISLAAVAGATSAFLVGVYGGLWGTGSLPQTASVVQSVPMVELDANALLGNAAALYDIKSGRLLYQKNAQEALPLASLTKVMAAETVLRYRSLDTRVTITSQDLAPEGDWGLKPGQTIVMRDLLRLALVASSNDAIEAAANSLGSDPTSAMNDTARAMGFVHMQFNNPSGLDVSSTTAGAYGSAYDMARLSAIFYAGHPDLFESSTKPGVAVQVGNDSLEAEATAAPLIAEPGFVAAKTGYTDLAGGNLVAVFDLEPGRTVVGVILGSTRDGRFTDMQTLIEAARKSL